MGVLVRHLMKTPCPPLYHIHLAMYIFMIPLPHRALYLLFIFSTPAASRRGLTQTVEVSEETVRSPGVL